VAEDLGDVADRFVPRRRAEGIVAREAELGANEAIGRDGGTELRSLRAHAAEVGGGGRDAADAEGGDLSFELERTTDPAIGANRLAGDVLQARSPESGTRRREGEAVGE